MRMKNEIRRRMFPVGSIGLLPRENVDIAVSVSFYESAFFRHTGCTVRIQHSTFLRFCQASILEMKSKYMTVL